MWRGLSIKLLYICRTDRIAEILLILKKWIVFWCQVLITKKVNFSFSDEIFRCVSRCKVVGDCITQVTDCYLASHKQCQWHHVVRWTNEVQRKKELQVGFVLIFWSICICRIYASTMKWKHQCFYWIHCLFVGAFYRAKLWAKAWNALLVTGMSLMFAM